MEDLIQFINELIIENEENSYKFMCEFTDSEKAKRISRGRSEDLRWQLNDLNHNVATLK